MSICIYAEDSWHCSSSTKYDTICKYFQTAAVTNKYINKSTVIFFCRITNIYVYVITSYRAVLKEKEIWLL